MKEYIYVIGCIVLTVYGQLIIKWRMISKPELPDDISAKIFVLSKILFTDPFIISGFAAAFLAALLWMAAMTKLELSLAYPFMSLAFVFVFIFSVTLLGEPFTWGKVVGILLIMAGITVMVKF